MSDAIADRERLRLARDVWRRRAEQTTLADRAYLVYLTLLITVVAVVPIVRAAVLALASPAAVALFSARDAPAVAAIVATATTLGALALGTQRGPVAPPPFVAAVTGDAAIASRAAWTARALRSLVVATIALTALAALAVSGHIATTGAGLAFVVAAVPVAVIAAVLWLAGQALRPALVAVIGVGIAGWAGVGIATSLPLTPWALLATLWPRAGGAPPTSLALTVLFAAGIAACAVAPVLIASLPAATVLAHAERWEAMTVLARTGDLSGAAGRLRSTARVGRRLNMPMRRPVWWATAVRDAVGAARTPPRTASAVVALGVAGASWGSLAALPPGLSWTAGLTGALVCFAALGALCDGLRHAADAMGRPPLFGGSPRASIARHALLPVTAAVVIPAAVALVAGGTAAALTAGALGALLAGVRVADSLKPALPIELLMPVPTAAGDASAMFVLLWQADAVLVTAAAGAFVAPRLAGGSLDGLSWFIASAAIVAGWIVVRARGAAR